MRRVYTQLRPWILNKLSRTNPQDGLPLSWSCQTARGPSQLAGKVSSFTNRLQYRRHSEVKQKRCTG